MEKILAATDRDEAGARPSQGATAGGPDLGDDFRQVLHAHARVFEVGIRELGGR